MSRWTLVPVRGLACGKSRLASLLDDRQRLALNTLLLQRVLSAVAMAEGGLSRCIVAAGADDAAVLARQCGAGVILDRCSAGLNGALEAAREHAIGSGATSVLALVADLPRATGRALARLADVPPPRAVVIADKQRVGTTGLLLPADCRLDFRFGPDSLARHVAGLRALGMGLEVREDAALSFDLDTPDDYRRWRTGSTRKDPISRDSPTPFGLRLSPQE